MALRTDDNERTSSAATGATLVDPLARPRQNRLRQHPFVQPMASAAPLDGVLQLDAVHKDLVHESFTCDTRDHEDHTCATSPLFPLPPARASTRGLARTVRAGSVA